MGRAAQKRSQRVGGRCKPMNKRVSVVAPEPKGRKLFNK